MATLLEQTRGAHEEIERLERLIVTELSREARSHRERLAQGHRVGAMVDRIAARAGKLVRARVLLLELHDARSAVHTTRAWLVRSCLLSCPLLSAAQGLGLARCTRCAPGS
jgi:hypothetical protein